ncbi:MAG: CoA transferase, partial [Chloroflexi bacterium]|nr:CoA transferase [Chloroflexota bacterium]
MAASLPTSLSGLRVVEWCDTIPGLYCGRLLAELGADVVKVEMPRKPVRGEPVEPQRGLTRTLHAYYNAGKRSVSLDSKRVADLVAAADVFVEDHAPGALASDGLSFSSLSLVNPNLVMASITPFGQTGPYARYKAYALNLFHAGGEGYIQPGGPGYGAHPDRPPLMAGGNFSESVCGSTAAAGIVAALWRRQRKREGDYIDLSCQEALMTLGRAELSSFPNAGFVERRRTRYMGLGGLKRTADGWLEMVVTEPR